MAPTHERADTVDDAADDNAEYEEELWEQPPEDESDYVTDTINAESRAEQQGEINYAAETIDAGNYAEAAVVLLWPQVVAQMYGYDQAPPHELIRAAPTAVLPRTAIPVAAPVRVEVPVAGRRSVKNGRASGVVQCYARGKCGHLAADCRDKSFPVDSALGPPYVLEFLPPHANGSANDVRAPAVRAMLSEPTLSNVLRVASMPSNGWAISHDTWELEVPVPGLSCSCDNPFSSGAQGRRGGRAGYGGSRGFNCGVELPLHVI